MQTALQYCTGKAHRERTGCRVGRTVMISVSSRDEPPAPPSGLPHMWGVRASNLHQCVPPLGAEPRSPDTGKSQQSNWNQSSSVKQHFLPEFSQLKLRWSEESTSEHVRVWKHLSTSVLLEKGDTASLPDIHHQGAIEKFVISAGCSDEKLIFCLFLLGFCTDFNEDIKVLFYRSSYLLCLMSPGRFGATEADLGAGRPGSAHEDSVSSGGAAAEPPTSRSGPPTPGGLPVWSRLPSNKFRAGDSILKILLGLLFWSYIVFLHKWMTTIIFQTILEMKRDECTALPS